jgi:hypothetical protein
MFQIADFSSINDLKFTYVRLQFQKFFPGVIPPDPHYKGEGRGRKGGEGRERGGERGGRGKEGRRRKGGMGERGEGGERRGRRGKGGMGEPPRIQILATALISRSCGG